MMMSERKLPRVASEPGSPVNLTLSHENDVTIGLSNAYSVPWNAVPCGEPVLFGIRHCYQLRLFCAKRCLRLAYRHACQEGFEDDGKDVCFRGFFLGKTCQTDDERGFIIHIDRFDPGTTQSDGRKMPAGSLPGDIIVPFVLMNEQSHSVDASTWQPEEYQNIVKNLCNEVTRIRPENACIFSFRLLGIVKQGSLQCNEVNIEFQWSATCISNSFCSVPINEIPIMPNALSRNLAGPNNDSSCQRHFETGFIAVERSQKLVLVPDSNTNSSSVQTIGIWISGVLSIHNPLVWLACLRYLHSPFFHDRLMVDGQFFIVLYSLMDQLPLCFQVKSDDNDKLSVDHAYAEKLVRLSKDCTAEIEHPVEFQFKITANTRPSCSLKEMESFQKAMKDAADLLATKPISGDVAENTFDNGIRTTTDKSKELLIGKNTSRLHTDASGSRGISFGIDLHSTERNIYSHSAPMPLPSPHAVLPSRSTVKPSVPELSMVFGENFSLRPREEFSKIENHRTKTVSSGVTLKSIENFIPNNQFCCHADDISAHVELHQIISKIDINNKPQYPLYRSVTPSQQCDFGGIEHVKGLKISASTFPYDKLAMTDPRMCVADNRVSPDLRSSSLVPHCLQTRHSNCPLSSCSCTFTPQCSCSHPIPNNYTNQLHHLNCCDQKCTMPSNVPGMAPSELLSSCHHVFPEGDLSCCGSFPTGLEWMKNVPPQARQLLMHQDMQLKQLRSQVKKLLTTQGGNLQKEQIERFANDAVAVSELLPSVQILKERSIESNTDLTFSNAKKTNEQNAPLNGIPQSRPAVPDGKRSCSVSAVLQYTSAEKAQTDTTMPETEAVVQVRCNNGQSTDKFPPSEFASIHLDEANLHEILAASSENGIGSHSRSSPINIDLPVLETSTDQSPSITLGGKAQCHNLWDAQDSPILGESASMCVVAPIDFLKLSQNRENIVNDESSTGEDAKDKQFMKTILDQVSGMLRKPSGSNGSLTEMNERSLSKSTVKPSKFIRKAYHRKVARATRRRLRKMGVRMTESSFAKAGDDRAKEMHDARPKPPLPCMMSLSLILGHSPSENMCAVPSTTEISMNANAIAQKYLLNDRLEGTPVLCKQYSQFSTMYSSVMADIPDNVTSSDSMLHGQYCDGSKTQIEGDLPGLSLISPSNMSLATRRYMEKYGLIEKATANGDDSTGDESVEESCTSRDSSSLVLPRKASFGTGDCSNNSHRENSSRRTSHQTEHPHVQEVELKNRKETRIEQRFSQLRVTLGDTLDMILPFLDDLDKHRQQTPSSDSNHEQQDQVSGCHISEGAGDTWPLEGKKSTSENFPGDVGRLAITQQQEEKENASQVLSPEILHAVAQYKKIIGQPHGNAGRATWAKSQLNVISATENKSEQEPMADAGPKNHVEANLRVQPLRKDLLTGKD